jgi:hypothetical protein
MINNNIKQYQINKVITLKLSLIKIILLNLNHINLINQKN